jgi:hypothetical protein
MAYSAEVVHEVWDDKSGEHWEVGQDRDSLGLVEIRYFNSTELVPSERIVFTAEAAAMIAQAMLLTAGEMPVEG